MSAQSRVSRSLLAFALMVAMLVPTGAWAEVMTAEGLDQTLAPIALYPDSLLGNVLVASTYPNQVVQANQWAKAHPEIPQDKLDAALSTKGWDKSVQALVAVPDVLAMMAGDIDWTTRLGTAFVDQTNDVYDSIQRLRVQAQATGALQSNDQVQVVTDDAGYVMIGSTSPTYVYVPQYQPEVVYGWNPGQVVATTALVWGTCAIMNEIFYGSCWDWHHNSMYFGAGYGTCGYWGGHVNAWGGNTINVNRNTNITNIQNNIGNNINRGRQNWNPGRQPSGSRPGVATRPGEGRPPSAGTRPGVGHHPSAGTRPGAGHPPSAGTRPGAGHPPSAATRPGAGAHPSAGTRPRTTSARQPASVGTRPTTRQHAGFGQRSAPRPSTPAFQMPASGSQARSASARGSRSRTSSPSHGGGAASGAGRSGRSGGGGGGRRR